MPIADIRVIPSLLKKRSMLELEKLIDSILLDGFAFPIGIGKIKENNWCIDGEGRLDALAALEERGYELPSEIPIFYTRVTEKTLRRLILASDSSFHCVTKQSLLDFIKGTDIVLPHYAFNEGTLIDFDEIANIELFFTESAGIKVKKQDLGLLA